MDTIVDSHVHLDLIRQYHPAKIELLKARRCTVISWAFGDGIKSVSDLTRYWDYQRSCMAELRSSGVNCYYLVGIHPRNIPPDIRTERIAELLRPYLDAPGCLGIGEIGLEAASLLEREVVAAQVELGLALQRPELRIGLHTPRKNKIAVTEKLLALLSSYRSLPACAVIDHCIPETIGDVLASGYHAGVTLSPQKTTPGALLQLLENAPEVLCRKIMCNSDNGSEFFMDFLNAAETVPLSEAARKAVFVNTAATFFSIP